jgi:hypothetical protein
MAKDWIGNKKSTFVTLGASNHTDKERQREDYYATDPIESDKIVKICTTPLDWIQRKLKVEL